MWGGGKFANGFVAANLLRIWDVKLSSQISSGRNLFLHLGDLPTPSLVSIWSRKDLFERSDGRADAVASVQPLCDLLVARSSALRLDVAAWGFELLNSVASDQKVLHATLP
jgi:hypothetical protein